MSPDLHAQTPTVSAIDARGLTVRKIAYHKAQSEDDPVALVTRMSYGAVGHLVALWDPRLWALAESNPASPANRTHLYNLAGVPLLSDSVDAGWNLCMLTEAGNIAQSWDARGSSWQTRYDEFLRPIAFLEIDAEQNARTIIRSVYADSSEESAEHNQCGQLTREDDTAGSLHFSDYGVMGQTLSQTRQFLKTPDLPDWTETTDYQDLVEVEEMTTRQRYNAAGDLLLQIDARSNEQRFTYSIAGALSDVHLRLNGADEQSLLRGMVYNAFGQVEEQTAGNDVISRAVYEASSGLLQSLTASRGANETVQALHYRYDLVGNVVEIEDRAQSIRFFSNQRVAPVNTYRYDSLYQLIEATGRESVDTHAGPQLPELGPVPGDTSQLLNYTEHYHYDAAGNMTQLRHIRDNNNYTHNYVIAPTSNRSLPELANRGEPDFDGCFDNNGNLQFLQPGQTLQWDLRNQLNRVTLLARDSGSNDNEHYIYDAGGQRLRKIRTSLTKATTRQEEVRYLPGLEIRVTSPDQSNEEHLEVVCVQAGRCNVRCLHWLKGQPTETVNDQLRYSLDDHLGSATLELDGEARLLSHEGYYPFGGTAWWAATSALEAKYKVIRYSGKERDASGLYYYGFRYYAPWLQRWINPDPAGDIDGLNLYQMVGNNPTSHIDSDGRMNAKRKADRKAEKRALEARIAAKEILIHKIIVHHVTLDMVEERVTGLIQQLNNYVDAGEQRKSVAKRSSALLVSALAKAGGSALGGIAGFFAGGVVTAGAGAPIGATLGAVAGGKLAELAADKAFEKAGFTTAINIKASALNPYQIAQEATKTATSLYETTKLKMRGYDPRDSEGLQKIMKTTLGSILGLPPGVGDVLKHAPDAAEIVYEASHGSNPIENDKWEHISANLETLEFYLTGVLPTLQQAFRTAGVDEISSIPAVYKETYENLKTATGKITDLISMAQVETTRAKVMGRRNSKNYITRL